MAMNRELAPAHLKISKSGDIGGHKTKWCGIGT